MNGLTYQNSGILVPLQS